MTTLELSTPETRQCADCKQEFTAHYIPQWKCQTCVDNRVRLTADELRQKRADEWTMRLKDCGIGARLTRMTLHAFQSRHQPDAAIAIKDFLNCWPSSQSVALLGEPGTGKTHLAVGVLLALAERGIWGRYVHMPTLVATLRSSADQREAERKHLDPLFTTPLVVFDDLGREKPTEHWQQWLDVLINDRWVNEQPIILTSNLSEKNLGTWLGGASTSRLLSSAIVVTMRSGDMRRVDIPIPTPKAIGDPTVPCGTCRGAGWLRNEAVPVGRPDRLMKCPACQARGY